MTREKRVHTNMPLFGDILLGCYIRIIDVFIDEEADSALSLKVSCINREQAARFSYETVKVVVDP